MEHSFNIYLATDYGILESILIKHLFFYIKLNETNNKCYFDNNYWTYGSIKSYSQLFPYVSEKQIRIALDKLTNNENGKAIFQKGNFNKSSYDRTTWYAFTEYGKSVCQKCKMDLPKRANGIIQKGEPIQDSIKDNKEIIDNKLSIKESCMNKTFIPPTLEEIELYCIKRNNNVDPKKFYDYYSENGWKDKDDKPVKNWKQKLIANWETKSNGIIQQSKDKQEEYNPFDLVRLKQGGYGYRGDVSEDEIDYEYTKV